MGLKDLIKKGAFVDILRGMSVTGTYFVVDKVTVEYPEEKLQPYPRFRGAHALLTDPETGDTKCVACMLCATICPSRCISIVGEQMPEGRSRPASFDLDLSRCIFCGLVRGGLPRGGHRDDPAIRAGHLRQERLLPRQGEADRQRGLRAQRAVRAAGGRGGVDERGGSRGRRGGCGRRGECAAVRRTGSHDREDPLHHLCGFSRSPAGLGVITRKNVVHALLLLVFTFLNVAAIFFLTQAYFLAVVQILVYAGAILVLFVFVIMLLNLRTFEQEEQTHRRQRWVALGLSVLVLAEFVVVLAGVTFTSARGGFTPEAIGAAGGSTKVFGEALFNHMLLPFEVASVVLLVAMVGAIILVKKQKSAGVSHSDLGARRTVHRQDSEEEV